jgi:hypothetical protein
MYTFSIDVPQEDVITKNDMKKKSIIQYQTKYKFLSNITNNNNLDVETSAKIDVSFQIFYAMANEWEKYQIINQYYV